MNVFCCSVLYVILQNWSKWDSVQRWKFKHPTAPFFKFVIAYSNVTHVIMSWVCFCQELAKLGDDWLSYHGVVRSCYALIIHCYILEKLMLLCFIRRISLILLTPLLWLDERQWWSVCAPHFDNGVVRGYLVIDAVLFHSVITRNVVEVLTAFCVSPVVDSLARRWTNVKACWHA